jgi:antitoxin (DNA-binding transcriptional repressor) of toxin-antitoxin stability system
MRKFSLREAKKQLSRLVDQAASDPFIITKGNIPLVKVEGLTAPAPTVVRRFGFLAGQITVPTDFSQMGKSEIARLFDVDP